MHTQTVSDLVHSVVPMSKDVAIADLATMGDGDQVAVTGELRRLQIKRTVLGELWATMILAQGSESVKALVFVRTFATVDTATLSPDVTVRLAGRIYRSNDSMNVVAQSVVVISP